MQNAKPPLTALIADDEPLARRLIREFLGSHDDIAIAGECDNGLEAVKQIAALSPDLVFLDIQMPKLTGLEVLEATGRRQGVIFTTAHDQHAIKAFDLHAVDYLLKPFSKTRFDDALARARNLLRPVVPTHGAAEKDSALDALVSGSGPLVRVLIRDGEQVHVIPVERIDCFESQGDYLAVHSEGKCYLKRQRISEIEDQLDDKQFLRVHRSFIINLAQLKAIEKQGSDGHAARLRSGQRVPVSRSGYERLSTLT